MAKPQSEKKRGAPAPAAAPKEEEAFPRGGAPADDGLTPLERRQIQLEAQAEVEKELASGKLPSLKKPKAAKGGKGAAAGGSDDEGGVPGLAQEVVTGKLPRFVELLKFKKLCVGTRLWGMVLEVSERGLAVSLPHGLRGHVTPSEASDVLAQLHDAGSKRGAALRASLTDSGAAPPTLSSLFHVGQYVRCCVVSLGSGEEGGAGEGEDSKLRGKKGQHIGLSLRLSKVCKGLAKEGLTPGTAVPAVVRNVEDHGYMLGLGIKGVTGFLRKADHEAAYGEGAALSTGALVEVVVKAEPDARGVVAVTVDPNQVATAVTRDGPHVTLDTLLPGALVNAKVKTVLRDGLLLGFLGFFTGSVDPLHMAPGAKMPTEGAKLRARVLYVNPESREVGLSLLPHLLQLTMPSPTPMLGQVFDAARVVRVDPIGLQLALPLGDDGSTCPAYCHVSNVSDERVDKLEKQFKPGPGGSTLRVRVIGFRLVDGLATVSAKKAVVEQQLVSYQDAQPGMPLKGTVVSVDEPSGLLVEIAPHIRALVPVAHMSDLGNEAGRKKYKVGKKVEGRVLAVDPAKKKLALTLKPALLGSKLPIITSLEAAAPGLKSHGVVTGVHDYGVFVSFYNGVAGLAPTAELGLPPGTKPLTVFTVGQVVRARVVSVDHHKRKISLSLKAKAAAAAEGTEAAAGADAAAAAAAVAAGGDPCGGLQAGQIVEGVVRGLQQQQAGQAGGAAAAAGEKVSILLDLVAVEEASKKGSSSAAPKHLGVVGRLELPFHLSDHPGGAEALKPLAVQPGTRIGPLVVLERLEGQRSVLVSRKPSLVAAAKAGTLPRSLDEVRAGSVVSGYVANVTADSVFVRFAGHVTGRAGLSQLADTLVSDPRRLFFEGQSVRAQVVTVDADKQRFSVTLRPSLTASSDASYLEALFRDLELAEQLKAAATPATPGGASGAVDWSALPIGGLAKARMHEVAPYGLAVDLDANEDLVGVLRPQHQPAGATPAIGQAMSCRVLDVSKAEGIVDLTAKPELLQAVQGSAAAASAKKSAKKAKGSDVAAGNSQQPEIKVGTAVEAVVELVKEAPGHYAVLSLPGHGHALAFAATSDFNAASPESLRRALTVGQRVTATVQVLPSTATGGRLLAAVDLTRASNSHAGSAVTANGEQGPKTKLQPGTVVTVTVTGVGHTQADVQIGKKLKGRVHLCEVTDPPTDAAALLSQQQAGVTATTTSHSSTPLDGLAVGQSVTAVVLGRGLAGPHGGSQHHGTLELSMRPSVVAAAQKEGGELPALATFASLSPGQLVVGVVSEVSEDHLWLSLSPAVRGRVHVLDASSDPAHLASFGSSFRVGQYLAARVVAVDGKKHTLDLTLQPQSSAKAAKASAKAASAAGAAVAAPACVPAAALLAGLPAPGASAEQQAAWVAGLTGKCVMGKLAGVKGSGHVRVHLGGKLFGRVALTDIHDTWVANALEGLKEGAFVRAVVLGTQQSAGAAGPSAGGPRLQLSLRPSRGGAVAGLSQPAAAAAAGGKRTKAQQKAGEEKGATGKGEPAVELLPSEPAPAVGQAVKGYVKHADAKGVFVALDRAHDARIKLCNLSDGFIEDPAAAFPEGARVEGRLVAVGSGRLELSLRTASGAGDGLWRVLSDFKEGEVVSGRVRRVEKFGVFVELAGSAVVGLAHISELQDSGKVKDPAALFRPKQAVKAKVLSIDSSAGRMSLSLKPSAVEGAEEEEGGAARKKHKVSADDLDAEMADAEDDDEEGSEGEEDEGEDDAMEEDGKGVSIDDLGDDSDEDEEDEEAGSEGSEGEEEAEEEEDGSGSEEEEDDEGIPAATLTRKLLAQAEDDGTGMAALGWGSGGLQIVEDAAGALKGAGEDGEGDEEGGRKLSKGAKKRQREEHERAVREAEMARLSGDQAPQSVAEFEAAVRASPSSSYTWIRYMAWLLGRGEQDAARAVAQRALDTIHYREDGEKFNVWVAWLNLEAAFGAPTREAALTQLFSRAQQYCDQKKLYFALLGIVLKQGFTDMVAPTMKTMTKKFGGSAKVWLKAMELALIGSAAGLAEALLPGSQGGGAGNAGAQEGAKKLLDRALTALPRRKHIKVITGAALLEFRQGSAERGRGIMEGVLRNYPKRLDLWSMYLDQEIKAGDEDRTRALFERSTSLPLPPRKMKFLFKRWLEWEKDVSGGEGEHVDAVKRKAMAFVESSLKA